MAKRKKPKSLRDKPVTKRNDYIINPQLLVGINAQPVTMLPAPYNIQGVRSKRIRDE